MNSLRRVLILGGIALATFGMLYGLHYAVFVEHQSLDRMGGSLASAFVKAAEGDMNQSRVSVHSYASTKYDYVRQVDAHSHWIGLAMVLILLGLIFDRVALSETTRRLLAWALLSGSAMFPLGVLLQTLNQGGVAPSALAICGSGLVIAGMAGTAFGLAKIRQT